MRGETAMNEQLKQLKKAFDSTYFHKVQLSKERKKKLKKRVMEKVSLAYETDVIKEVLRALNNKSLSGYDVLQALRLGNAELFMECEGELYAYLHHMEQERLLIGHWTSVGGVTIKKYSLSVKGIKHLNKSQKTIRGKQGIYHCLEEEGT